MLVGHIPVDNELAFLDTVTDPVEAHVSGFGVLLSDGFCRSLAT
jgi:hypothetical protein